MGRYLAIGLRLETAVKKEDVKEHLDRLSLEDVCKQVESKLHLENIYTRQDTDNYYVFRIKDSLLEEELIPFLKKFYELRYKFGDEYDVQEVMETLSKESTLKERLALLERKRFQTYQEGSDVDYLRVEGGWSHEVYCFSNCAVLSIDGKIMMECYKGLFEFFRCSIIEQLSQFKLSQALHIWIDG